MTFHIYNRWFTHYIIAWDDPVWGVQAPAKGFMMGSNGRDGDPLGFIENDHLQWIYPLKMMIFHSYVKLPEGNSFHGTWRLFEMVIFHCKAYQMVRTLKM